MTLNGDAYQWRIPGQASNRRTNSGSLRPFLRRRERAWGWGYRSAGQSSNRMAAVWWQQGQCRTDRSSKSSCPAAGRNAAPMKKQTVESVVYVIDDDASVRDSLKSLFGSVGLHVELFDSADDFLQNQHPDVPCCLVLDVRLPGLSGLEFQGELAKAGTDLPIIFMTGHGDIPMTVQAMKAGAGESLP